MFEEGLHNRIRSIAAAVVENPMPISDKEHVAMVLLLAQVENECDDVINQLAVLSDSDALPTQKNALHAQLKALDAAPVQSEDQPDVTTPRIS